MATKFGRLTAAITVLLVTVTSAAPNVCYNFRNVRIGGGGGFVPGIVFNPNHKGLAYARTDIGGAYRLKTDGSHEWEALQDGVNGTNWGDWYVDSIATDPIEISRVYLFTGAYTNGWDPNPAYIHRSVDYGRSFVKTALPFKGGGNMPGRGMGERLAIDPNNNRVLYVGARSGNGLWKSSDYGATWAKVTSFPQPGTWAPNPADVGGLDGDIIGVVWVTFDENSGYRGQGSKRIFVGVAEKGKETVFVSNDSGATWSAVAGQPIGHVPHKGVLSPKENVLYITYTDGAGPYDGGAGSIQKYNLTSSTWTDISPLKDSFGYGGVAIDAQAPGTLMVATLNQWWPDANIWRSTDSGKTWTGLWEWAPWPQKHYFDYDVSAAPWLYDPNSGEEFRKLVGWMIESLAIDPFDSNHFLYGTGATIFGSRDALKWGTKDARGIIKLESLATGIEETSIQAIIAPPVGPPLISAVGDIGGFVHNNLDKAPEIFHKNPNWATAKDIDFAGNAPTKLVRIGTDGSGSTSQVAISDDSGVTWREHPGAPQYINGGSVALSANGTAVLWRTGSGTLLNSPNGTAAFTASTGIADWSNPVIAADKRVATTFFAATDAGKTFYISTDSGKTFLPASVGGFTGTPFDMQPHPTAAGTSDLWLTTSTGLFRSKDAGKTFTKSAKVGRGYNFSLGAPKTAGAYPAIYLVGDVDGVAGVYRSDDEGKEWVKVNVAGKWGGGSPDGIPVAADLRVYGRVFLGTNGRGIFVAEKC
ncbi:glycoside hydrolase family 74 protein [Peziza echinospora]|nr:glycoside hydrolase family 74 protein [Peziza echinospora]